MNIGGGITFLVHVIIIIVHWIIKRPIHFLIILFIFIFYIYSLLALGKISLVNNNVEYIYNYSVGKQYIVDDIINANKKDFCNKNTKIDPSKKYVILMLDDLHPYLRETSLKIINEAISRKIPYTLGITPLNVKYDSQLSSYLLKNKCNLELAQYGFNNREDIPEFKDLPKDLAEKKLDEGLKILKKLTDKKITTFIFPDNVYSYDTLLATKNKDFKIISGNGDAFFDYMDSTNNINEVVNKSIKNNEIKGFSIIKVNPKDYVNQYLEIDSIKYKEYIKLLDELKNNGFSFITISDYYNYLSEQNIKTKFFDKSVLLPEYADKILITK